MKTFLIQLWTQAKDAAETSPNELRGLVEHIGSGCRQAFADTHELLAWLRAQHPDSAHPNCPARGPRLTRAEDLYLLDRPIPYSDEIRPLRARPRVSVAAELKDDRLWITSDASDLKFEWRIAAAPAPRRPAWEEGTTDDLRTRDRRSGREASGPMPLRRRSGMRWMT
jgi:hypothetical protein